ncbi:protein of unknown function (plasmid) [Cupriavidus taiwanensis]|uniref:Uncharacterized protein n=1 Tax=Cupriavidus taiwanensis TaxID=164546 RepID=A0A375H9Y0_9BURK|nr:protein of unknown function [Cupriavidus taiwanensis]SOZ72099.1 protein of unknown function [Cupriavidus taiwanensis]SOZ74400.1 protein of unknown function [Cupriavidus taiwanensis]SPA03305.1 protein of unknown function [Cupriavidus taiwanensis]SPA11281.1 protein of unknown function [Cupriavidus taiwanensis]
MSILGNYYGDQLLLIKSLFATAQAAGLSTATIGKSGAAYIQDLGEGGYFLDEITVQPRSLVTELQNTGIALPLNTRFGYSPAEAVTLTANNDDPTARAGYVTFNTTTYDSANDVIAVAAAQTLLRVRPRMRPTSTCFRCTQTTSCQSSSPCFR